jgi:phosphoribulokinase
MSASVVLDPLVAPMLAPVVAPIVVGIVGDSGSGRTTLVQHLRTVLADVPSAVFCLDDYHRLAREERRVHGVTALSPDANDLGLAADHLAALRRGEHIEKPVYRHESGTHGAPEIIAPTAVLLVTGLLGFATPALADQCDVRVFMDPDPELWAQWKRARDTRERGYDDAGVRTELEARRGDRARYVQPQRGAADVVIGLFPQPGYWSTRDDAHLNVRMAVRHPALAVAVAAAARALPPFAGRPLMRLADSDEPDDLLTLVVDGELSDVLLSRFGASLGAPGVPLGPVALTAAALVVAQLIRRAQASLAG